MKKSILWAILAMLLPFTQAWGGGGGWGGGDTHYYAKLKASVASSSTGMGKVYAGTSATVGTYNASESESGTQDSTNTAGGSKTFYAFAQPDDNFEFDKWEADSKATITKTETYGTDGSKVTVTVNASSSGGQTETGTVTAYFKKKSVPAFAVSFVPAENGSYTVGGNAPADQNGLMEAYTPEIVATPASGYRVFGWYTQSGDTKTYFAYTATATLSVSTTTTIGVEFVAESEVAQVTTLEELSAALNGSAKVAESPWARRSSCRAARR